MGLADLQRAHNTLQINEQPDREVFAILIELKVHEKIL